MRLKFLAEETNSAVGLELLILALSDRLLCGFWSLFLRPSRLHKLAIAVRPSTLLGLHAALVRRKYRRLFSAHLHPRKPGPKGPSAALIRAIVELKSRNPVAHGSRASSRARSASTSTGTSCVACSGPSPRPRS